MPRTNPYDGPPASGKASRRSFPAAYKLDIVAAYDRADQAGRRLLLERDGLSRSQVTAWRQQRDRAALAALDQGRGPKPAGPPATEVDRLAAENLRLGRELSLAQATIEAQGGLCALLRQLSSTSAA